MRSTLPLCPGPARAAGLRREAVVARELAQARVQPRPAPGPVDDRGSRGCRPAPSPAHPERPDQRLVAQRDAAPAHGAPGLDAEAQHCAPARAARGPVGRKITSALPVPCASSSSTSARNGSSVACSGGASPAPAARRRARAPGRWSPGSTRLGRDADHACPLLPSLAHHAVVPRVAGIPVP